MKTRTLLFLIAAIVAGTEILVAAALAALGYSGGLGATAVGAAIAAAACAVPVYLVASRPTGARGRQERESSRGTGVQDLLIAIDTMAMEGRDPDAILRSAAEGMRRVLQVPRCTLWLIGSPRTVVEHRAMGLPPAATDFPLRESPEFREAVFRSDRCTAVEDARKTTAYRGAAGALERFGARSFLEAPLRLPEGPIGFLFVGRPEPFAWSEESIAAAEAVAGRIAAALSHAREIRERREAIDSLLSVMDHVPGLVYRGERDWTMTIVSAEVERMTGYAPREFIGGTVLWKDLIHPDDLPAVKMAFRDAVARGRKVLRIEYRARHKNGDYRWFVDRRQIIYDDRGHFLCADGLCLDITERKRAEHEATARAAGAGVAAEPRDARTGHAALSG